jgi:hypothetical protein
MTRTRYAKEHRHDGRTMPTPTRVQCPECSRWVIASCPHCEALKKIAYTETRYTRALRPSGALPFVNLIC